MLRQSIIDRLLVGDAHEVDIGAVDEAPLAVELGHPHRHRRRIGDQAEALLALADPLLGRGVAADRGDRAEHAGRRCRPRRGSGCSRRSARSAPRRPSRLSVRGSDSKNRVSPARRARHWAGSGPRRRPRSRAPAGRRPGRGRRGSRHRRRCRASSSSGPQPRNIGTVEPSTMLGAVFSDCGQRLDRPERRRRPILRPASDRPARRERRGPGLFGLDAGCGPSRAAAPVPAPKRPETEPNGAAAATEARLFSALRRPPGPGAAREADCRP